MISGETMARTDHTSSKIVEIRAASAGVVATWIDNPAISRGPAAVDIG
jgi:hypothetical protein